MVNFTVAICTYNGEARLGKVLEKLRLQVETEAFSWEILVIDNNSTDNTAFFIQEYILNWTEHFSIKYFFEAEQGLAFARRCAVREAKSDLIGFLDDDNLPEINWVAEAYKFGLFYPNAGAYGGQIHGKFEVEPPQGFERIARYFALLAGNNTYCYNDKYKDTRKKMFPPGAGIVIRKKAWLECVPQRPKITGVSGDSLLTKCEDVEILSYLLYKGWELWFNKNMIIYHYIPKNRFQRDYIVKFFKGVGLSRHQTRMIAYKPWQRSFATLVYLVNDFRKTIVYFIKYKELIKSDVVAAGEIVLLVNITLSPFLYWKKKYLNRFINQVK